MGLLNDVMGKDENSPGDEPSEPPKKEDLEEDDITTQGPSSMPSYESGIEGIVGGDDEPEEKPSAPPKTQDQSQSQRSEGINSIPGGDDFSDDNPLAEDDEETPGLGSLKASQQESQEEPEKPSRPPKSPGLEETDQPQPHQENQEESQPQKAQEDTTTVDDGNQSFEVPDFEDDLDVDVDIDPDEIAGSEEDETEDENETQDLIVEEPAEEPEPEEEDESEDLEGLPKFDVDETKLQDEVGYSKGDLYLERRNYANIIQIEKSLEKNILKAEDAVKDAQDIINQESDTYRDVSMAFHEIQEEVMKVDKRIFEEG